MFKKLFLVSALLLVGCAQIKTEAPTAKVETAQPAYKNGTMITAKQLKEKLDNKDSFIVVLSHNQCTACQVLHKALDEQPKNDKLFTVEVNAPKEEVDKLKVIYPDFRGTPTTLVIKEGVISNVILGAQTEEVLKALGD